MPSSPPQPVHLFNTLTRTVEPLRPLTPGSVSLYCCGPTVYHFAHLGNFRTYLFEDILVRTLRASGYTVNHVMNITDVGHLVSDADAGEDKMLVAMRREQKSSAEIAAFYTEAFFKDAQALNIVRPSTVCAATAHINEMIEMIQTLEEKGYAYRAGGNVYFDIQKFPQYGDLAKLKIDAQEAGARVDEDKNKRQPCDFALWFTNSKFQGQELQWDSPWGRGYPGWHIECSAMARKYLGERFDIHCGGVDHIPVHHTNEIAQSNCACGHQSVTTWMHSEFLVNENNEKISKSKGGFFTVADLKENGMDPISFRLLCLGTSYRKQLKFSFEIMRTAHENLQKLRRAVIALGAPSNELSSRGILHTQKFLTDVADDLNTAKGLAVLWEVLADQALPSAERRAIVNQIDQVLGLGMADWQEEQLQLSTEVQQLLAERSAARAAKNWTLSDSLRLKLQELGYLVEDKQGQQIVKKL